MRVYALPRGLRGGEGRHGPEREGDVRHSYANIDKAKLLLNYKPKVKFQEGLFKTYKWYQSKYKK